MTENKLLPCALKYYWLVTLRTFHNNDIKSRYHTWALNNAEADTINCTFLLMPDQKGNNPILYTLREVKCRYIVQYWCPWPLIVSKCLVFFLSRNPNTCYPQSDRWLLTVISRIRTLSRPASVFPCDAHAFMHRVGKGGAGNKKNLIGLWWRENGRQERRVSGSN